MCDPELGALEDIRGDISAFILGRIADSLGMRPCLVGHRLGLYVGRVLYVPEAHLSLRWSIGPETHAECPLPSHSDDATTSIPRR